MPQRVAIKAARDSATLSSKRQTAYHEYLFVVKAVDAGEASVRPMGKGAVGTEGDQCSGGWVRKEAGGDGAETTRSVLRLV